MQCRICHRVLPEGSIFCPSCQSPVPPPPAPVEHAEQFMGYNSFREYAGSNVQTLQPFMTSPMYPPVMQPLPNFYTEEMLPVAPNQSRSRNKLGLILAFVLVIVVSMSTGSLLTFLFLQHNPTIYTSATNVNQNAQISQPDDGSFDPQALYSSVTSKQPINSDQLNEAGNSYWTATAPLSTTHPNTCQFKDGSFHVTTTQPKYFYYCTSQQVYENFAFQVEANILQGYAGGIAFRATASTHTYYIWHIDSTGMYQLTAYNRDGSRPVLLSGVHTPYFKSGYNQKNLLTIIAHGSDILLYVNQHYINHVKDETYSSGCVGLLSDNDNAATDISFTNAKVWIV